MWERLPEWKGEGEMKKNEDRVKRFCMAALSVSLLLAATGCHRSEEASTKEEKMAFAMQQEHLIIDQISLSGDEGSDITGINEPTPTHTEEPTITGTNEPSEPNEPGAGDGDSPKTNSYENVSESVAAFLSTLPLAQEGKWMTGDKGLDTYFYLQIDERWADTYYGGTDTIAKYACGPTCMSIVISSLTDIRIDPVQMSTWAKNNGYWFEKSGSLHSLIPDAAEAFGLKAEGIENTSQASVKVKKALEEGKFIVTLMGKGQFTQSGHFIVLRGLTDDGKVLVADPASQERTDQTWDLSTIIEEAKTWAAAGGPFWVISK